MTQISNTFLSSWPPDSWHPSRPRVSIFRHYCRLKSHYPFFVGHCMIVFLETCAAAGGKIGCLLHLRFPHISHEDCIHPTRSATFSLCYVRTTSCEGNELGNTHNKRFADVPDFAWINRISQNQITGCASLELTGTVEVICPAIFSLCFGELTLPSFSYFCSARCVEA